MGNPISHQVTPFRTTTRTTPPTPRTAAAATSSVPCFLAHFASLPAQRSTARRCATSTMPLRGRRNVEPRDCKPDLRHRADDRGAHQADLRQARVGRGVQSTSQSPCNARVPAAIRHPRPSWVWHAPPTLGLDQRFGAPTAEIARRRAGCSMISSWGTTPGRPRQCKAGQASRSHPARHRERFHSNRRRSRRSCQRRRRRGARDHIRPRRHCEPLVCGARNSDHHAPRVNLRDK